jgi:hypothetical protein
VLDRVAERVGRSQQFLPQPRASLAALLAARHRPQGEVACAARQRLGHAAHQEQVGRAREQETPRRAPPVDRPLDGVQQLRRALHLVEHDGPCAAHERLGVAPRDVERVEVVQRTVAALTGHEPLRQRALVRLPRPGHHDRRHRAQPRGERGGGEPRQQADIHAMHDNHSWRESRLFRRRPAHDCGPQISVWS